MVPECDLHRGYDTSFGYFHHDNDYWTEHVGPFVDLWETNQPAWGQQGNNSKQGNLGPTTEYEEYKFEQVHLTVSVCLVLCVCVCICICACAALTT